MAKVAKTVIVVGVASVCALGAGWGWQASREATKKVQAGGAAPRAPEASRELGVSSPNAAAAELDYAVDFETTMTLGAAAATRVSGNFALLLVEREPDHGQLVVSGKVKDVVVVVESADDATRAAVEAGITKDLEQTFALVLESSGKIARFGVSPTLSAGTESLLRAAVSSLQLVAAPRGGDKTWQTVEADHYGSFAGSYRALAHDRIEKQKVYTKLAMPELLLGADSGKSTAKGASSYELADAGHWPKRVESKDELDTGALRVGQRFTLTLQQQRSVQRKRADLSQTRMTSLSRVVEREGGAKSLEYTKRVVGGATYQELASQLPGLGTSDEEETKRDEVVRRLAALFELDAAAVKSAEQAVRDRGPGSKELLGALTSSPAREARSALNRMAADRALPTELRSDVLAEVTIQARPTSETFDNLASLMNDADPKVRSGATLALGSTAESAAADASLSREAERANSALSQGYESAATPAERSLFLKALGNSGSAQTLAAAKSALGSPDPAVRREGVRALRLVPGDEADQLIAHAWQLDEDAGVRDAAAFAAGYRPLSPALSQAALSALAKDPSPNVRLRTLALLGENLAEDAAFAPAIRKTAQDDPSKDVRDAALRYLRNT